MFYITSRNVCIFYVPFLPSVTYDVYQVPYDSFTHHGLLKSKYYYAISKRGVKGVNGVSIH